MTTLSYMSLIPLFLSLLVIPSSSFLPTPTFTAPTPFSLSSSSQPAQPSAESTTSTNNPLYIRKPRPPYTPSHIPDPNYVRIFDTTLRDGEQSPGATLTSPEKLTIARQLALLGVDIIEAGFPVSSNDDFEGVKDIAMKVGNEVFPDGYVPVICGLSRANKKDIKRAWDAVKFAKLPRIHTFIATSDIHMVAKLNKTKQEVLDIAVDAVAYARSLGCNDVEFSPEDAGRSDPLFLYEVIEGVINAGATTINIPDTTGWNMPWEYGTLISKLLANVPSAKSVIFSTHCQNDLGLSTANSLSGALNGARQLECTINGIGERAGNAALEEVVMSLAMRGETEFTDNYKSNPQSAPSKGGLYTSINPVYITATSKMVSQLTGMSTQPHKAIVGVNAFQHESGIHQDGMIKNKATYEIMTPESVGLVRGESGSGSAGIVLGKLSGRNAVGTRLKELGYNLDTESMTKVFTRFKEVAEKKKGGLEDDDLEALVADQGGGGSEVYWTLVDLQVITGMSGIPTATVTMVGKDGVKRYVCSTGTGPVDAVYKGIDRLVGLNVNLLSYSLNAVNEGIDALAKTRVSVSPKVSESTVSTLVHSQFGYESIRKFSGSGADGDILVSSARAYVGALNKMIGWNVRQGVKEGKVIEKKDKGVEGGVAEVGTRV